MTATALDRRFAERDFHDRQAAARAALRPNLRFQDDDYLDHESWVRFAFERLGPLRNKSVLDYGCGHGMAAVALARAGAQVTAFDLSPGYVNEAKLRAAANGVQVDCVVADGEELPFADASFDAVWGNAILHHLDLEQAGRQLHRVLRPGGTAVFCEPWGGNPALALARRFLPYAGKDRTADERPLCRRDLAPLRAVFPKVTITGHQLFGMLPRLWRTRRSTSRRSPLDVLDSSLLRFAPPLWNWCRYVVIELKTC